MAKAIRKTWVEAQATLHASINIDPNEARLEAQLLLQHALKVNQAWLIAHENDALQSNIHAEFEALLNRRVNGEPMAYILGRREFYGLELMVTPDTLIPRPDTETLVEAALGKIPLDSSCRRKSESSVLRSLDSDFRRHDDFRILDLGTGTGAIALAIAKHRPLVSVTAVDASKAALEIARKNAENLNVTNVQFVLSDWFDNLDNENNHVNKFNVIVSNPPYIAQNDAHLTQGDLRFEPLSALTSGVDGLDDIRQITNNCLIYLKPQGWLMLEHGYHQAESVTDLMAQTGLTNLETMKDIGGNNRVTIGKNPLMVSAHWD